MRLLKNVFKIFFSLILLLSTIIVLIVAFFIMKTTYEVEAINLNKIYEQNSSKIYDKDNNLIAEIGLKKQDYIQYNDIDDDLINAVISIEDHDFFNHQGYNLKRIAKACYNNIVNSSFDEGASTITQQLVKNLYLTNDKTIERKIKEYYLSIKLENYLTKSQILEAYLNNILFGERIYGVNKASNYYFGHDASSLTIPEAALLAGIIQLPNYYNPYKNYEDALKRRNLVLLQMHNNHFISYDDYLLYKDEPIVLNKKEEENFYSSYLSYVIKELKEVYNIDIYKESVSIYTNMDRNIQDKIENILLTDNYMDESMKCGIICMDNKTGKIEGIGGIRSYNMLGYNYATDANLSPGSTIKPILDYGPAFEYLNYGSGHMINDEKYSYLDGTNINNWDHSYKGYITLRQALAQSRNIPAVKLFNEVGWDKAYSFAKRLGIEQKEPIYEANAIGGFSYGYTVLEMTNAYSTFANMGLYVKGHAINYIKTNKVIKHEPKTYNAIKKETAFLINDILHSVIAGSKYNIDGLYLSAKTGQSNYDLETRIKYNIPSIATKDSWFIGYTKDKTIGVWNGYDSLGEGLYLNNQDKEISRTVWKTLMKNYDSGYNTYEMPNNLIKVLIERGNEYPYLASSNSKSIAYEYFYIGTEPKIIRKADD